MLLTPTREDRQIAWLSALAIGIHVLESALPSPLPGVKPGLANVVTIAVLRQFGWVTAAWVTLLRVLAGSLLLGTFLSPTFVLSFSGALASMLVLGPAVRAGQGRWLGPVGLSVLAALAHMSAQVGIAYLLYIPNPGLFYLLPVLMTFALIFGIMTGIIARNMLIYLAP